MKHPLLIALCTASLLLSSSCDKDRDSEPIPAAPVDVTLLLDQPANFPLSVVGGWIYISGGSAGIIVYRTGPEEFVALDRHCPYNVNDVDRVYVEENGVVAVDSLGCGSRFVMLDGSVTEGPATFPLTSYQTTFNATVNRLRIFN